MAVGGTAPRAQGVALFAWVKRELLAAIARGEFSPDEPFVTQREIVERFGVSTTTAVRALTDLVADGVVVRRRGRGTFVAQHPPARVTAGTDTPVVAYVSPDDGSGCLHDAELLAGLSAEAATLGLRLMVAHTRNAVHEEEVLRTVVADGANAVVLFPHERSTAAAVIPALRRDGVVTVLVDRYFPGLPTDAVVFDDFAVGHDVTAAMIERGHTAMALLWSETEVTSVRDRLAGHRRALREKGLPELPELSALRPFTLLDPAARSRRLRGLLDLPEPPTALLFGNAPSMAVAVTDLLAMDTAFPGALELASMDQSHPGLANPLAVASARLPTREMGRAAARLVRERLTGSTAPTRHRVLPVEVDTAAPGHRTLMLSSTHQPTVPGPA